MFKFRVLDIDALFRAGDSEHSSPSLGKYLWTHVRKRLHPGRMRAEPPIVELSRRTRPCWRVVCPAGQECEVAQLRSIGTGLCHPVRR